MDFELLGAFYLGKEYDPESDEVLDRLVMYDARDLTTHAVCVGMTGSGKTGLCIDLLEEAAMDRVPALIIDPKGDITNLLLTFPDLQPEDFRPWINPDDARRKGLSEEAFAEQQAELWRKGLARWGQSGERIRALKETADFVVYTPGSDAGVPVSILQSFAAPGGDWESNAELLRERIQGTVGALLGLIGVEADPIRSREHILLSNVFEHYWRRDEDLDLPKLILAIQEPPVRQLGVFDVDTFFPAKDRFALAMLLNNLIAAPAFQSWMQGQPLDVAGLLNTPEGKPRHAVFYVAHLSDAERMFFVTMLLNQVITWMRTQPGTTSLRALLYMDEVFGFFPPVANPPSKQPLLTLLKQGRAFGLGVVLTTQNPADLDYKGLTNAGTWFVGRLQTERDKQRLMDGLESAGAAGQGLDREALNRILGSLKSRVFLLHNVHEPAPLLFQTRWAMSYLRGPLTRAQVRELAAGLTADAPVAPPRAATGLVPDAPEPLQPSLPAPPVEAGLSDLPSALPFPTAPPALPESVTQRYLPLRKRAADAALEVERRTGVKSTERPRLLYVPGVLGMGRVHFVKQTQSLQVDTAEPYALLARPPHERGAVSWNRAQALELNPQDLREQPQANAYFDVLPEKMNESHEFTALRKELEDHLYRSTRLTLLYSPELKLYSHPDETEREFQARLRQAAREARDAAIDVLEEKYAGKIAQIEERIRKAEARLEKKAANVRARKQEATISLGETLLGAIIGRRRRSASTIARQYNRAGTAKVDYKAAEADVEALEESIAELEKDLRTQTAAITEQWEAAPENLEEIFIKPRRVDVVVAHFTLAWAPHWRVVYQGAGGVTGAEMVPAF